MLIYKITNNVNGKIYVGKHIHESLGRYFGSGTLLKRAIRKYGREKFSAEILEDGIRAENLDEREEHFISLLNSTNKEIGYNITPGGDGGDTFTNNPNKTEISKKISASGKRVQRAVQNRPEVNAKRRKTLNENGANIGWKKTDKQRSTSASCISQKEETKMKIRKSNSRGRGMKQKGKTPTNAVQVSIEGIQYDSMFEAATKLNINLSTLRNRLVSNNPHFEKWIRKV